MQNLKGKITRFGETYGFIESPDLIYKSDHYHFRKPPSKRPPVLGAPIPVLALIKHFDQQTRQYLRHPKAGLEVVFDLNIELDANERLLYKAHNIRVQTTEIRDLIVPEAPCFANGKLKQFVFLKNANESVVVHAFTDDVYPRFKAGDRVLAATVQKQDAKDPNAKPHALWVEKE